MRKIVHAVATLVLLTAFQQSYTAQSTATIEGVVLDAGTDQPLEGVRVSLAEMSEPGFQFGSLPTVGEVVTDAQGRFRIESRSGRFRVVPILSGFVFSRPDQLKAPREPGVWVTAGDTRRVQNIQLRMDREAIIRGRALDQDGRPATGANAFLSRYRYDEYGNRTLRAIPGVSYPGAAYSFVRLDDRGEFRLYGLQSGDYYIRIAGRGVVYYPGTRDESQALPVHVNPGEEVDLGTMTLPSAEKQTQVRFRLKDGVGTLRAPDINLHMGSAVYFLVQRPEEDYVTFPLSPGRYDMTVSSGTNDRRETFFANVILDVGTSEIEREVSMTRAFRISGNLAIQDANGRRPMPDAQCRLRSEASDQINCFGNQAIPGLYRLEMPSLAPDIYLLSATASGRDVLRDGLQVQADTELEVVLGTPGAIVEGTVRKANGDKLANAVVALVPDSPLRNAGPLYGFVISDVSGNFELRGIAPGSYHLFAWPELEGAAYRNAEFMKEYDEKGTPVVVGKGARLSMDVTAF